MTEGNDPIADRYVKGAAFQWSGKYAINMTHESFPEKLLIQSENECGNGDNDWEYAKYVYGLLRHYLTYGANAYVYWNMVLEEGGMSTWGWRQNAMVTVTKDQKVHYNHEYYIMKHFSRYIKPGAVRLRLKGHFTANSTAFRKHENRSPALSRFRDRKPVFAFQPIGLHDHTGLVGKCPCVCACEHAQTHGRLPTLS